MSQYDILDLCLWSYWFLLSLNKLLVFSAAFMFCPRVVICMYT